MFALTLTVDPWSFAAGVIVGVLGLFLFVSLMSDF